jgi:translocator protein
MLLLKMYIFLLFVPQTLSILTQIAFPSNFKDNKKVFFQPPGYVFAIVWTLIYFFLGYYLFLLFQQKKTNQYFAFMLTIFSINLFINLSWTPVVNIYKKYKAGVFMIAFLIFTLFTLIAIDEQPLTRTLLVPYLSWLVVALLMNIELLRMNIIT